MDQFITEECPSFLEVCTEYLGYFVLAWILGNGFFQFYMIVQLIGDLVPSLRFKTECYNTLASFPGTPLTLTKNKNGREEPST